MIFITKETIGPDQKSKAVGCDSKQSVLIQLIFSGYTTDQVLRLELSLDGEHWSSAQSDDEDLTLTKTELDELGSLCPCLVYELNNAGEVDSFRISRLSGDGTVQLIWRLS